MSPRWRSSPSVPAKWQLPHPLLRPSRRPWSWWAQWSVRLKPVAVLPENVRRGLLSLQRQELGQPPRRQSFRYERRGVLNARSLEGEKPPSNVLWRNGSFLRLSTTARSVLIRIRSTVLRSYPVQVRRTSFATNAPTDHADRRLLHRNIQPDIMLLAVLLGVFCPPDRTRSASA